MARLLSILGALRRPVLALVAAFAVGAVFIVLTDIEIITTVGKDPLAAAGMAVSRIVTAYLSLIEGAFGDPAKIQAALGSGSVQKISAALRPITETLVNTTPLIFTGLAISVAFRTGVFNVGAEGQFILGGLGSTIVAILMGPLGIPAPLFMLIVLAVGMFVGGLWGFIPGVLKARFGANEVITTIMLNYVAFQIIFFVLQWDAIRIVGNSQPISRELENFVTIPRLLPMLPSIRLHIGLFVALGAAALVSWFLFRTTRGFELRASGLNASAARYSGIGAVGAVITAMTISGALAGLGGAFQVVGTIGQMSTSISSGYGFTAIALALLGRTKPSGVVAAAFLFGALQTGGALMQVRTEIPMDLLKFVQALVIIFIAAPELVDRIFRNPFKRTKELAA
jgi:simple sugar transport system permease protein